VPPVHLTLQDLLLQEDPAQDVGAGAPVGHRHPRAEPVQIVAKALDGEGGLVRRSSGVGHQLRQRLLVFGQLAEHALQQRRTGGRVGGLGGELLLAKRLHGRKQPEQFAPARGVAVDPVPRAPQKDPLAHEP